MRILIVIVALASVCSIMTKEIAAQAEGPFVFHRICNIEPGQDAAAVALAQEMVDLVSRKHPSAKMVTNKGRWMTGFQEIAQPVNQILFTEQHLNLLVRQDFTDALLDDDDFQTLQRKAMGVIDISSCVETHFRASP